MSLGKLRAAVLAIALAIATAVATDASFMQSTRHIDRCEERARAHVPPLLACPLEIHDYDPFADIILG